MAITGLPATQPYSVVYAASGEQVYEIGRWTQTPGSGLIIEGPHTIDAAPEAVAIASPMAPRRAPAWRAEAQWRDAPRHDADAIFGTTIELDSAASVSIAAPVGCARAALPVSLGGGAARAGGESRRDADGAARQEEEADDEEARRGVAVGGERRGTSPERGGDRKNAARSRPRTSLGGRRREVGWQEERIGGANGPAELKKLQMLQVRLSTRSPSGPLNAMKNSASAGLTRIGVAPASCGGALTGRCGARGGVKTRDRARSRVGEYRTNDDFPAARGRVPRRAGSRKSTETTAKKA